ncbi:zinc finger, C3HC4 type (RING finger) domain protein, partial [Toxoplasma gondii TgCatPRC2]
MGCVAFFGRRSTSRETEQKEPLASSHSSSPLQHEAPPAAQSPRERAERPGCRPGVHVSPPAGAFAEDLEQAGALDPDAGALRPAADSSRSRGISSFDLADPQRQNGEREAVRGSFFSTGENACGACVSSSLSSHTAEDPNGDIADALERGEAKAMGMKKPPRDEALVAAEGTPYKDLVSETEWARVLNLFRRAFCEIGLLLPVCRQPPAPGTPEDEPLSEGLNHGLGPGGQFHSPEDGRPVSGALEAYVSPGGPMPALALPPASTRAVGQPSGSAGIPGPEREGGTSGQGNRGPALSRRGPLQELWDVISGRRQAEELRAAEPAEPHVRGAGEDRGLSRETAGGSALVYDGERGETEAGARGETAPSAAETNVGRAQEAGTRGGAEVERRTRITTFYRPEEREFRQAEAVATAARAGIPVEFLQLLPPEPPRLAPTISCVGRCLSPVAETERHAALVDATAIAALDSGSCVAAAMAG